MPAETNSKFFLVEYWERFTDRFVVPFTQSNDYAAYLLVAALVMLLWVVLLVKLRHFRKEIRIFDNQVGGVQISNRALSQLIYSTCAKIDSVHKPKVKFQTKRDKLNLVVRFKSEEGKRVQDIVTALQSKLNNTLQEILSIEKTGRIDVIVTGFMKQKDPNRSFSIKSSTKGSTKNDNADTVHRPSVNSDQQLDSGSDSADAAFDQYSDIPDNSEVSADDQLSDDTATIDSDASHLGTDPSSDIEINSDDPESARKRNTLNVADGTEPAVDNIPGDSKS